MGTQEDGGRPPFLLSPRWGANRSHGTGHPSWASHTLLASGPFSVATVVHSLRPATVVPLGSLCSRVGTPVTTLHFYQKASVSGLGVKGGRGPETSFPICVCEPASVSDVRLCCGSDSCQLGDSPGIWRGLFFFFPLFLEVGERQRANLKP